MVGFVRLLRAVGAVALLMLSAPGSAAAEPPKLSILYNQAVYGDAVLTGNTGSSGGLVRIPPGARVGYASLSWSGCGPGTRAVTVRVGGRTTRLAADRYTVDETFYTARADATAVLAGSSGDIPVTVGDVHSACAGGWSLVAVWMFDGPRSSGRKQITVYDTHIRLHGGDFGVSVRPPGLRPAGGGARIGVIAYGGDRGLPGDRFLVDGRDPDGSGNFFAAPVTVRWVTTPAAPNEFTFSSGLDSYVVQGIAVVTSMPELTVATEVDRAAAHAGDEVTQTLRVANTGGAPALDVVVRNDSGCVRQLDRLAAGQVSVVRCRRSATPRQSAAVTGMSLLGERLSAETVATMEVLRPAVAVEATAAPSAVLKGQPVGYEIGVRNTGNTPLSTVVSGACEGNLGWLAAGESRPLRCSAPPGDPVRAVGTDKLGLAVTAETRVAVTVVVPRVSLTVTPSSNAARAGESITFIINVKSATPLPLEGLRVAGTPAECARDLGTVTPTQTVTYSCTVTVTDRLNVNLSVGDLARATAIVSVVPEIPPPLPPPVARRAATAEDTPEPVSLAALIGGLAVLSNLVMVGGFAATACRPK